MCRKQRNFRLAVSKAKCAPTPIYSCYAKRAAVVFVPPAAALQDSKAQLGNTIETHMAPDPRK